MLLNAGRTEGTKVPFLSLGKLDEPLDVMRAMELRRVESGPGDARAYRVDLRTIARPSTYLPS